MELSKYDPGKFYDEVFSKKGVFRDHAVPLIQYIKNISLKRLRSHQKTAESIFFREGITFNVYGDRKDTEKIFPFDLIPRVIPGGEWRAVEQGLKQRIKALNLFIADIYSSKVILKKGIVPEKLVLSSKNYLSQCKGLEPANGIWVHISGSDLIRDHHGKFYVLEDNLRCPSGISYAIENRSVMKRCLSAAFTTTGVQPIEDYADHLLSILQESSYTQPRNSRVVVLTPGPYNSAYFEHAFLAQQMGVQLVESSDIIVNSGLVKMRTTGGLEKIDVIYRRIDDEYIDPQVFRKDSLLGIPGIMDVFRNKKVSLVNAPGAGIADDKGIYPYVPEMIKFYLQEDPILSNVETYSCSNNQQTKFVLDNIKNLVVKATNLSGGYGMLIGNKASQKEIDYFREKIQQDPRNYIAQPIISLSTTPTLTSNGLEARHVDLRPFVLCSSSTYITPGGLTRVALQEGCLVVNSSQGGGSKDTWVTKE